MDLKKQILTGSLTILAATTALAQDPATPHAESSSIPAFRECEAKGPMYDRARELLMAGQQGRATELLQPLAEDGDGFAQSYLASLKVPNDLEGHYLWAKRSMESGCLQGLMQVAHAHERGFGVARDPGTAFPYYLKAAEHGQKEAMQIVARAYANGHGVERDPEAAKGWERKASK